MTQETNKTLDALLSIVFQMRRGQRDRTLQGIAAAMETLPVRRAPLQIQIVGTNGKGSTAAMLASILRAAGLRTGLFTSPHLLHFGERFRIDGMMPSPQQLTQWLQHLLPISQQHKLAFFDIATLLAACLFTEANVDAAIYEAGIGGRLDATTALPADLVILTSIGRDHQQWLGATLRDITSDKAAAFRPKALAISGATQPALGAQIAEICKRQQSLAHWHYNRDFHNKKQADHSLQIVIDTPSHQRTIDIPNLSLRGQYQHRNASLAAAAYCLLDTYQMLPQSKAAMPDVAIPAGLSSTVWPGRLQLITWQGRRYWLDGAHNPEACQALAQSLPSQNVHLVYGAAQDKDHTACLEPLLQRSASIHLCQFAQPRAATRTQLQEALQQAQHNENQIPHAPKNNTDAPLPSVADAINAATQANPTEYDVLITGSLFVVAEALHLLTTPTNEKQNGRFLASIQGESD